MFRIQSKKISPTSNPVLLKLLSKKVKTKFPNNAKPSLELKSRVGYLQQEAANSGESALQKHAGHNITCGEIRLVGGRIEATRMQEPNISDVVET